METCVVTNSKNHTHYLHIPPCFCTQTEQLPIVGGTLKEQQSIIMGIIHCTTLEHLQVQFCSFMPLFFLDGFKAKGGLLSKFKKKTGSPVLKISINPLSALKVPCQTRGTWISVPQDKTIHLATLCI